MLVEANNFSAAKMILSWVAENEPSTGASFSGFDFKIFPQLRWVVAFVLKLVRSVNAGVALLQPLGRKTKTLPGMFQLFLK